MCQEKERPWQNSHILKKEPEHTLYMCIELHRLQITFMCIFCSDSQNNFMTFEETEAWEVDAIVQDAQTAHSTCLGLPGALQPRPHVLKLLSLQLGPPFKKNQIYSLFIF